MNNIDGDMLKKAIRTSNLSQADKQALEKASKTEDMSVFLNRLSPEQSRKLKSILADEAATKRLLSTPQAQMLLKKLLKK